MSLDTNDTVQPAQGHTDREMIQITEASADQHVHWDYCIAFTNPGDCDDKKLKKSMKKGIEKVCAGLKKANLIFNEKPRKSHVGEMCYILIRADNDRMMAEVCSTLGI